MNNDLGHLWAVHSEKDGMPQLRGWARSEAEAQRLLEQIRADDGERRDDQYWVMQMTKKHIEHGKNTGFIPKDA
jgi:hypothetical protein